MSREVAQGALGVHQTGFFLALRAVTYVGWVVPRLGEDGARVNPALKRRLKFMHDAHSLWYARGELVAVLSQLHGEALAVHRVQSLSPVFQGLIPRALIDASRIRRV